MKVSIIIPAYNAEDYISKCLNSVISQTYKNFEVIVLNDGSTDLTKFLVEQFLEFDDRIILINKPNTGTYSTRKMGLKKATGDLVFNLDADDFLEKNALELLVKKMFATNANLVIGNHFHIIKGKRKLVVTELPKEHSRIELIRSLLVNNIKGYLWGKLFSKELLFDLDLQVENMLQEDFLVNLHVFLTKDVRIAQVSEPVYNYIVHPNSANSSKNKVFIENVIRFNEIAEELLREYNCYKPLSREFKLYKCRNWVVYARMGGSLAKNKNYIEKFYKENYTSFSKINLATYQNIEMLVYRRNYKAGKLLTRSFKKIQEFIY